MICPNCRATVRNDLMHCQKCGADVNTGVIPSAQIVYGTKIMTKLSVGQPLLTFSRF